LNLSFGCHYAIFLTRFLGFLEFFSNSPLSIFWVPLTSSSLPLDHHKNHLIWVDSSLMVPLSKLSFESFWLLFLRSRLLLACSKNHLIWVDSIRTVPLRLQ
jgi:hypothetical protein